MKQEMRYSALIIAVFGFFVWACQKETPANPKPVAEFDYQVPDTLGNFEVKFTNRSKDAQNYEWDFGDGTSATQKDQAHKYKKGGLYTVRLTAISPEGSDRITKTVKLRYEPRANFTIKACDSLSYAPCEVAFTNTAINAASFRWDFGDGTRSTDPNPRHQYGKAGIYEVILTVSNEIGKDEVIKTVQIAAAPKLPVALFEANGANCTANCRVTFTNISQEADSYEWDFGDGTTAKEKNPVHEYKQGGLYTVRLTARSKYGTSRSSQVIRVLNAPVADFDLENENCASPCGVRFVNRSQNVSIYLWDFGNGRSSTDENPTHTFITAGNYMVSLTAINSDGKRVTATKQLSVR